MIKFISSIFETMHNTPLGMGPTVTSGLGSLLLSPQPPQADAASPGIFLNPVVKLEQVVRYPGPLGVRQTGLQTCSEVPLWPRFHI